MREILEEIAEVLEMQAEVQQKLARLLTKVADSATSNRSDWIKKQEAADLLKCSADYLRRYREYWQEGVHYSRISAREYLYNGPLIMHWKLHRSDPRAHEAEVEKWILSQR